MNHKVLNIDFRYLCGNIACLSVDSVTGKNVHNDIDNDEAIIIFNSLVGEKENCITVKSLQQENQQLKDQLQQSEEVIEKAIEKLSFIDDALEKDILNVPLCITKINKAIDILNR